MTPEQWKAWAKRAFYLGYISDPDDIAGAQEAYYDSVTRASNVYTATKGSRKMTPEQALMAYANQASGTKQVPTGPDGKPLANRTIRQRTRNVDVTDSTQAKNLVTEAFKVSMGREPTDAEVRTLTRTLQAQEATRWDTNTTHYDQYGQPVDSVTTHEGGVDDPQAFLSDKTNADPEAAAFQGATTYFNGLLGVLGSAV